ncbi:DUF6452 family protein [Polaribacter sp.]|uniref:DUF6452 family protein n=1 Tax=Polaribacter sp. TaxID=1920175 RepID=UPI003F6A0058
MKKTVGLISILLLFFSCEKDDFCTQNPVTPNLILRFYDSTNRNTIKKVDNLYVWAEGKDSLFVNASLDSLYIPLNTAALETVYYFSKDNTINQFTISYSTANEYVSRSCGYKVIFNEVSFTSNNSWINDFEPNTPITIENQNKAHVQIFH